MTDKGNQNLIDFLYDFVLEMDEEVTDGEYKYNEQLRSEAQQFKSKCNSSKIKGVTLSDYLYNLLPLLTEELKMKALVEYLKSKI